MVERVEKASNDVSLEQLQRFHSDEEVKDTVYDSPLQDLFLKLVDAMHTDSQESMERMAELRTKPFAIKLERHPLDDLVASDTKLSNASQPDATKIPPGPLPPSDHPRYPMEFTTPAKKRNISETTESTMPSNSTETTPKKMYQPESKVQSLQNKFMETLINKIWKGEVIVPWAQGRKMILSYAESSLVVQC